MKYLTLGVFLITFNSAAHEAGETRAQIGPGLAVEAYDEHEGLKLSTKAVNTLGLKTTPIEVGPTIKLPISSLVNVTDQHGIYVLRSGWFKFVPVKVTEKNSENIQISSKEIKPGDEVAVSGVPLLRVAHMNLLNEEDEHEEEGEGEHHDEEENHADEHDHDHHDHHDHEEE
jgi:hypothetical protein